MKKIVFALALTALPLAMPASAAEPVAAASPTQQSAMLASGSVSEVANKKLVDVMWRTLLLAGRIDEAGKFLAPEYHQHNPNADTGLKGFEAFFNKLHMTRKAVPATIPNLVAILAQGDLVVLATKLDRKDAKGKPYTTTWFDMFRIKDDKIVEHWDCAPMM